MTYTRVYNDGSRVTSDLSPRDLEQAITYDHYHRPGCAVFRDAECVQQGYLDAERCAAISEELRMKLEGQRP